MIDLFKYTRFQGQYARYRFDPSSLAFQVVTCDSFLEANRRTSGTADQRRVGLWNQRWVFVALYLFEDKLTLALDGRTFDWPGPFRVRRRTLFPRVKSFQVCDGDRSVLELRYFHRDNYDDFPEPQASDIFLYIAQSLRNPAEIERTIYWSRASAAGRNLFTNEFLEEVEEHLFRLGLVGKRRPSRPFFQKPR